MNIRCEKCGTIVGVVERPMGVPGGKEGGNHYDEGFGPG